MQFIPTNDVFHHLLRLKGIVRDKKLIIDIFKSQGWEVSKSKVESWDTKTGNQSKKLQRNVQGCFRRIYQ